MPIEDNIIHRRLTVARIRLRALVRTKSPPGLVIQGPPGLGKTMTVSEVFEEYAEGRNNMLVKIRPSPRGLLQHLHDNRDGWILFDDCDRVFYNPDMLEIMKIVLDSTEPRILSNTVMGESALEPFRVTAGVVFCTNFDLYNPARWPPKLYEVYIKPLIDRLSMSIVRIPFNSAAIFEYTLFKANDVLNRVQHEEHGWLTPEQKKEIIDHFTTYHANYPMHTPRVLANLGNVRLGIPNDKEWRLVRRETLNSMVREKERKDKEAEAEMMKAERTAAKDYPEAPAVKRKPTGKSPLLRHIDPKSLPHLKGE